jgi:5-methylthioadenosine/S-adenosylhomocysteine deaminase
LRVESSSLLIRGGLVLTLNDAWDIVDGDVSIREGRIAAIGPHLAGHHDRVVEARGGYVLPGLIQTHIHLCQTLFRGYADDLALMDWLRSRVWPMEAAHTPASLRAATRLAKTELLCSGTTSVLTMETVHDTDVVFEAVAESGLRATIGKCMMDKGDEVPEALNENTEESIAASVALLESWNGKADGRIRYCFAPRFAISCTAELLSAVARLAREHGVMIHTHASENQTECALVEQDTGMRNITYLDSLGLTGRHVAFDH